MIYTVFKKNTHSLFLSYFREKMFKIPHNFQEMFRRKQVSHR